MFMNYITITDDGETEILVAVIGKEDDAKLMVKYLNVNSSYDGSPILFQIRSLSELLNKKIKVPQEMKWIVESDSKYHKRLEDDRVANICDGNALSF